MTVLDIIEDFGERVGADGQPVDELLDVLSRLPANDDDPAIVSLAAAIAQARCDGDCRPVREALKHWQSEIWH